MALAITKDSGNYGAVFTPQIYAKGNIKLLTGSIAFDNSYPTGGEAMDLSKFFKNLLGVFFETKSGYIFEYDYTNKKVKALYPRAAITSTLAVATPALAHTAGGTAVTSTAATMPDHAAGAACTITGVAGVAAGAGAEVPDTTDLSALTGVRFLAWGY